MNKKIILVATGLIFAGLSGFSQSPVVLTVTQSSPLLANAGTDVRINSGESVTIGGNPSASMGYEGYIYLWSPAQGLNNPTLANPTASPTTTTTYSLTVTDAKNCTATDEVTVTVGAATVETTPSGLAVRCYPNPVADELLIEMTGITSDLTIRLISPLGKEMAIRTVLATSLPVSERIPMLDLPAGIYFLQVISVEKTFFQPILKTRQP